MKRLLLSVFAAALTTAWAVPSTAADFTFGGEYRLRTEYREDMDFNKNVVDGSDFWMQRVRLTANAKATEDTTVKITLQDTRMWGATTNAGGGPQLTDNGATNTFTTASQGAPGSSNSTDLHESYLNVAKLFDSNMSVRLGRQELAYGDQRLIGHFGWSNNGRSFDAIKFTHAGDVANVDLFYSKITEANITNTDQEFSGIYASSAKLLPGHTLDVYALTLRDHAKGGTPFGWGATLGNTTVEGTPDKTQVLNTYGVRVKGATAGIDYTAELPVQRGSISTRVVNGAGTNTAQTHNYRIKASAFALKVGYNVPAAAKLRIGFEYDRASGDKSGNYANGNTRAPRKDETINTFFNLFPTNHDKLGLMDQQAWRNVRAWNLNASLSPMDKVSLLASYWKFKLDSRYDAWYGAASWNTNPAGIRAANTETTARGASDDIGREIDLIANYKYNSSVTLELGAARFLPGKFVKNKIETSYITDKDTKPQDWAYFSVTSAF
ncbi:MAG: alginate export family protein [Deltaproteobacteria bacterium]|nr:alginate export family protein [Deltaproteobacteria bacterium]